MPTLKPGTIIPTPEEDAKIAAGIAADPDTYELSHEEFQKLKTIRQRIQPTGEALAGAGLRTSDATGVHTGKSQT